MSLNHRMGDRHEADLAAWLHGRRTKASGSQWADQMDGRHSRYAQTFAFAWDGKSTLAKSVGVSRAMLAKAVEQAHGERPMVALRFYDDERLRTYDDWAVVRMDDLREMLAALDRESGLND